MSAIITCAAWGTFIVLIAVGVIRDIRRAKHAREDRVLLIGGRNRDEHGHTTRDPWSTP